MKALTFGGAIQVLGRQDNRSSNYDLALMLACQARRPIEKPTTRLFLHCRRGLTFDVRGLPKAGPLDGVVRPGRFENEMPGTQNHQADQGRTRRPPARGVRNGGFKHLAVAVRLVFGWRGRSGYLTLKRLRQQGERYSTKKLLAEPT